MKVAIDAAEVVWKRALLKKLVLDMGSVQMRMCFFHFIG